MKISLAPWLTPIAAVLLIAATSPARAQQPVPPAAKSAALDLYREWKAEPDPARKAALGQRIVAEHFGTKAAEAVGYAGMFPQPDNPASKLEMSRTYYDASLASGETGAYV